MKHKKEMLCDYLGAGKAYYGKDFTFKKELEWWITKKSKPIAMHPNDITFIDRYMRELCECDVFKSQSDEMGKLYLNLIFKLIRKEK